MKTFEIPSRWYVKNPDNEESHLLYDYFNKGVGEEHYARGDVFVYPNFNNYNGFKTGYHSTSLNSDKLSNYTEITFEEFKTHILNLSIPEKWKLCFETLTPEIEEYLKQKYGNIDPWIRDYVRMDKISIYLYSHDYQWFGSPKYASLCNEDSYEEITHEQFVKHVLKKSIMKTEKVQTFGIKGSPELLDAIAKRLAEVGYDISMFSNKQSNMISHNTNKDNLFRTKEEYARLYNRCEGLLNFNPDKSFILPQDYDEAIQFAKEQLDNAKWPKLSFPFASLIFTIDKERGIAICKYGIVTKEVIQDIVNRFHPISVLGYELELYPDIKFGCQTGTLQEAKAILEALS